MNHQELVGKIAADKNSKRLGKIIKIEKIQDQKTKIWKEKMLILVHNIFRKDVVILVDAGKLLKAEVTYALFDLEKDDFEQEVRETRALMRLYKD
ncbi:MAG: hypothetical protein GPJ52_15090 [Candidatus Heimdallarchaeota archaeon]|nr:hypothetical protein [Candidatus Heimdallarchaeota archaeon]MCG3252908.1 hypothetical protein [Candidatus Heimdallarchaeota archaeon]MCK4290045.1 hypothetical protein [Candidatus Heimdallarchaeota archaeon]